MMGEEEWALQPSQPPQQQEQQLASASATSAPAGLAHASAPPAPYAPSGVAMPAGVVVCPGLGPGMVGCSEAVAAARRLLEHHFPGVPWLGEQGAGGEGEEADGGGARDADDEGEDEAIAALQAALGQLQGSEAQAGAARA